MTLSAKIEPSLRRAVFTSPSFLATGDSAEDLVLEFPFRAPDADSLSLTLRREGPSGDVVAVATGFEAVERHSHMVSCSLVLRTQALDAWRLDDLDASGPSDDKDRPSGPYRTAWLDVFDDSSVYVSCAVPILLRDVYSASADGYVSYSSAQSLSADQAATARANISAASASEVAAASDAADGAKAAADGAKAAADGAGSKAESAAADAASASSAATEAKRAAETASSTASRAQLVASEAKTVAGDAFDKAKNAAAAAAEAKSSAASAQTAAETSAAAAETSAEKAAAEAAEAAEAVSSVRADLDVAVADVAKLQTDLASAASLAESARTTAESARTTAESAASAVQGKADLVDGRVPSHQLPSFVSGIGEFDSKTDFPAVGEAGLIYVARDTNLTYRWGGSAYVEVSPSIAIGETAETAFAGSRGKALEARGKALEAEVAKKSDASDLDAHVARTDNPHAVTAAQVGALPLAGGTVAGNLSVAGDLSAGCVHASGGIRVDVDDYLGEGEAVGILYADRHGDGGLFVAGVGDWDGTVPPGDGARCLRTALSDLSDAASMAGQSAQSAQSTADEAMANANAAQSAAAAAQEAAESAKTAANGAATTAEKAAADAAQASAAASDAGMIADSARIAANSAEIKAGDAKIDAQSAVDTAQSAVDTAQSAVGIGMRVEAALDEHVADKANPHAVTAAQVGAYTKDETDSKVSEVDVREQLSGYVTKTEVEPNEVYSGFADSAVQALYLATAPDSSQKIGFETVSGSVYPYLYDGPFSAENNALLIRGDVNPSSSNIGFAAYADHALTANSAGSADAAGKVPWTGVTDKPDVATKSELYAAVTGLASEAYVNTHVATKQDRIDDLAAIRAGAEKGTTALQAAPVTSVSGKTGAVTLVASDIGALPASAQTDGSYVVEEKTAFGAGIDLPAVEGSVADVTGTAGITPVNDGSRLGFVFSDGNSGSQSRLFADGSPVMTMTACDERYAQVSGFVTASSQLLIVDGQPTAIEHGKFYCWKAESTAATSSAVTLEDNGKENEARLYLDYRTAASQISFPSDATVLYRDGSVKLNAFEVGNRYFVDLQWFSTSQREGEWESSSIVVVNAYKVAAAE